MIPSARSAFAVSILLGASAASAQVQVEVQVPPPPSVQVEVNVPPPPEVRVATPEIRYEAAPPLVEAEPGVQVVPNSQVEVFFVGGWYWHPGPGGWWYRTRDYRGGWMAVPPRHVPRVLVRIPRGRYRHFRREERKEMRREEKAVRREERAMEKERRREERERRHGD